jgi:hypothetical protein
MSHNHIGNLRTIVRTPHIRINDAYFVVFPLTRVRHSPNMVDQISSRRRIGCGSPCAGLASMKARGDGVEVSLGACLEWWLSYRDVFGVFAFELEPITAVSKIRGTQRRVWANEFDSQMSIAVWRGSGRFENDSSYHGAFRFWTPYVGRARNGRPERLALYSCGLRFLFRLFLLRLSYRPIRDPSVTKTSHNVA